MDILSQKMLNFFKLFLVFKKRLQHQPFSTSAEVVNIYFFLTLLMKNPSMVFPGRMVRNPSDVYWK